MQVTEFAFAAFKTYFCICAFRVCVFSHLFSDHRELNFSCISHTRYRYSTYVVAHLNVYREFTMTLVYRTKTFGHQLFTHISVYLAGIIV